MIKLSERYSCSRDRRGWELIELYEGKDKDGKPKMHESKSYFLKLQHVLNAVIDIECGMCNTLDEVHGMLMDLNAGTLLEAIVHD